MRKSSVIRFIASLGAVVLLTIGAGGCSADEAVVDETGIAVEESSQANTEATVQPVADAETTEPAPEGDGDYVFGLERDNMVEVVKKTYVERNAKARWEGNVFVVAIDGDAEEDMAGFSDCRVLTQLLNEGDEVTIEYPNGNIDCSDALDDD